jgi:small subunit ribosomal protein S2
MTDTDTLIPYEQLLQAGAHFGRKRTVYCPKMKEAVFSVRDGICIIDLLKTQEALIKSLALLNETLQAGGLVLFVAPTKQSQESMMALALKANMPYVMDRWLGGTLTNFKNINSRVKRLVQLEDDKAAGRWEKYTKKEQLELSRELADMKRNFEGLKKLTRMPDLVFVSSLREGALAVHEAKKMGVKVMAVSNTDADPSALAAHIPANDRSKRAMDLIVKALTDNLQPSVQ